MKALLLCFLVGCAGPEIQAQPSEPQGVPQNWTQPFEQARVEQKQTVEQDQQKNTTLQEAYVQAQVDLDNKTEEDRDRFEARQYEGQAAAFHDAVDCQKSAQCLAAMVCHQVEDIAMWKRAIHDEMRNPSGVVNLRLLHEWGEAIQQNEYYVKHDLEGTAFTVAQLCKS